MGLMTETLTASQYAEQTGKEWGSASKALLRAKMPTPKNAPLTDDVKVVINRVGAGRIKTDKKTPVPKSRTIETPAPVVSALPVLNETKTTDKDTAKTKGTDKKTADKKPTKTDIVILYCLAVFPTVASVRNIWIVCMSVMGEWVGATALTLVLCSTGIALTYIGVRSRFAVALVVAVMAFETLANVTTIFAGLFDTNGLPLKFLGTVTTIFNAGTHITAIILAVFAAVLLVGTQLAAIFELQKRSL